MKLKTSRYKIFLLVFLLGFPIFTRLYGQPVPGKDENIPFLVTFGKDGKTSWGDNDFYQVFFFSILKDYTKPLYIRVFDPDCGGEYDEIEGEFDTKTKFSVYGGKGVDPEKNEESRGILKGLNYKSGPCWHPKFLETTHNTIIIIILSDPLILLKAITMQNGTAICSKLSAKE